jgi:hypothetical protein
MNMRLLGFGFKKIEIERISESFKDLKINTNINILSIKKVDSSIFKGKEEVIQIGFSYTINYSPEIAKIEFVGEIFLGVDSKELKEIVGEWEKKIIFKGLRVPLFNTILRKSNVKALQLEDEFGLPLHIKLPSIKEEAEKEKKE